MDEGHVEVEARSVELPLDDLTPEELLGRYVGGSDDAFTCLVERMGGRLFGFVCRYLGDLHEAEDVYQGIWTRVASHAASFDGRARFRTWLYQIARNGCMDALRRRRRNRIRRMEDLPNDTDSPEHAMDRLPADTPAPDAQLSVAELGARIAEAVEGLPEQQREVFLLREDGDLTFEEIGLMLGCGKETAKSRMRYAMEHLQRVLSKEARLYGLLEHL